MRIARNVAMLGLLMGGTAAALAATIIHNPKIIASTGVNTGIEARFQFAPGGSYDSSVSGTYNLGNVGPTSQITNNLAYLINTPYDLKLQFAHTTGKLTWTITGGALTQPNVLIDYETDSFNSLRFNTRTMNLAHTLTWSNLVFQPSVAVTNVGSWPSSGTTTNAVKYQRLAAGPGELLSTFDWEMTATVSTTGVSGSQVKMWIASHMVDLKPGYYGASTASVQSASLAPMSLTAVSAVPEPSTIGLMSLGILGLAWYRRRAR